MPVRPPSPSARECRVSRRRGGTTACAIPTSSRRVAIEEDASALDPGRYPKRYSTLTVERTPIAVA